MAENLYTGWRIRVRRSGEKDVRTPEGIVERITITVG